MSSQRITIGVIAKMKTPVGDFHEEVHQDLNEKLEDNFGLALNYDGDILIYTDSSQESCHVGLVLADQDIINRFERRLQASGVEIYPETVKIFFDHWYDGCDSNHKQISVSQAWK